MFNEDVGAAHGILGNLIGIHQDYKQIHRHTHKNDHRAPIKSLQGSSRAQNSIIKYHKT